MHTEFIMSFLTFIVFFISRVPVGISMMVATVIYFILTGNDISMLASVIMNRLGNNYLLMAAPLFMFTANVMNSGEVTERLFKFSNGLVGIVKGGLAHVNIFISLVFSGMTGSAIADVSGLGPMEIEAMKKEGYDDEFSCAITAASATIGPVFPPSLPMVIYALFSGASLGALFLAGMVPGVLLAIALYIYVSFITKKRNYPVGKPYTFKEFIRSTLGALPVLLTPVILLVGIYTGIMTPTESGAVAGLYALIISVFIYRTIGKREMIEVLKKTVIGTGMLGIIIGGAFGFSFIFAAERIPDLIANYMVGVTQNPYIFLLLVNIVFLIMGMFLNTTLIQVVFLPMVIPVAKAMGIDMVHFGVITTLNMMIGMSTPPLGVLLFLVSGLSGTPLGGVIKEMLPLIIVMLIVLFIITYFPGTVLFLPNLL